MNPVRLSPRASSQICGFCHSHSYRRPRTPENRYPAGIPDHGPRFRPGDELEDSVETDSLRKYNQNDEFEQILSNVRFWPDGLVRGSGREYTDLAQSPCFGGGLESGQLGCLSCHTMHKDPRDPRALDEWANDQLKPGMNGDEGCQQCHKIDDVAGHTHHSPDSSGSRCYNCHMPHTTYGLMKAIRSHRNTNPNVATTLATGRPNVCNLFHLDKSLGWTADHLSEWYGQRPPRLTAEQKSIASSILWALRGDAAQRVLIVWHMGWKPALHASGVNWQAMYLGQLLQDPYDVVRYVAYRSLRQLPGYGDFQYDWLGSAEEQVAATQHVHEMQGLSHSAEPSRGGQLLIAPDGTLQRDLFDRLLRQRNDRPTSVEE